MGGPGETWALPSIQGRRAGRRGRLAQSETSGFRNGGERVQAHPGRAAKPPGLPGPGACIGHAQPSGLSCQLDGHRWRCSGLVFIPVQANFAAALLRHSIPCHPGYRCIPDRAGLRIVR